ncbi:MAG: hypothetical protein JWN57_2623 [Frankiales bacterium]|nr:hypothetical protein [Frankiales bacterium]
MGLDDLADALAECADRYAQAVAWQKAVEARHVRLGPHAPGSPLALELEQQRRQAAVEVLATRLELQQSLIDAGWTPDSQVRGQIDRDRSALDAQRGGR